MEATIQPNFRDGDYRKPALISLLLHFLVVSSLVYAAHVASRGGADASDKPPSLQLLTDEEATYFIPSELMATTEVPPEDTPRISDRDTLMRGEQQRNEDDRADQTGVDADVVVLRDAPESPESLGQASADSMASQTVQVSQANPATPETTTQENSQQSSTAVATELPEIQLPTLSAETTTAKSDPTERTKDQEIPAPQQRVAVASRAAPPPSRMSFQQQKTRLEGRAPDVGPSSWDARGTTLGEYQADVYRRVGELWHRMIRERRSLITYGRAVVQVEISSSGRITFLTLNEWPERGTMLGVVSEASIRRASPFKPFPENLRRQVGDTMQIELTFVVY